MWLLIKESQTFSVHTIIEQEVVGIGDFRQSKILWIAKSEKVIRYFSEMQQSFQKHKKGRS